MKQITYEEWAEQWEARPPHADIEDDEAGYFNYYDNGAVMVEDGDFVLKCDMVRRRK
jgi:hypothetical protein